MRIKRKLNIIQQLMNKSVITFIIYLLINVISTGSVYAQFSGGSQTGSGEATIGSDIFTGGSQTGNVSATSGSNGSLSHGDALILAAPRSRSVWPIARACEARSLSPPPQSETGAQWQRKSSV